MDPWAYVQASPEDKFLNGVSELGKTVSTKQEKRTVVWSDRGITAGLRAACKGLKKRWKGDCSGAGNLEGMDRFRRASPQAETKCR